VPAECIPAFDRMGGVWSESYGHGAYWPVTVIPYAFTRGARRRHGRGSAVEALGIPGEIPHGSRTKNDAHNERTAWIDDGDGSRPDRIVRAAPMLRRTLAVVRRLRQGMAA